MRVISREILEKSKSKRKCHAFAMSPTRAACTTSRRRMMMSPGTATLKTFSSPPRIPRATNNMVMSEKSKCQAPTLSGLALIESNKDCAVSARKPSRPPASATKTYLSAQPPITG